MSRGRDPFYECLKPAMGWDVPEQTTLFLVLRGQHHAAHMAIHAPRGSSLAQVLAVDFSSIAFTSNGDNILEPGPHRWKAPLVIGDLSKSRVIARAMSGDQIIKVNGHHPCWYSHLGTMCT